MLFALGHLIMFLKTTQNPNNYFAYFYINGLNNNTLKALLKIAKRAQL